MAFGVGGPGPGDEEGRVLSDINVTPLVDVMLVLLIIFMITAPMLHQGIEVALPQADAEPLPVDDRGPLILSVNRDGMVYVGDEPVHPTRLEERLVPLVRSNPGQPVFVKGDRGVEYGRVVEVLDTLDRAGVTRIGMVTDPPDRRGRPGGGR